MEEAIERWGYQEVATPTFEHLELFTIKSGEGILEEIYQFKDKGGRDIALRPELTAPVMRMYVSELQNSAKPLRLYYFGNCFRYERPQKGRFREFWQFGAELIGGKSPDSEAEAIALADDLISSVGIDGDFHVGHLGLIRTILGLIPPTYRPGIMRMIDKKERERLAEELERIGADHLGLCDLIDLKGRSALDKAVEIARDLPIKDLKDSDGPADLGKAFQSESSGEGKRSARAGREVEAELGLDQFQEMVDLLDCHGVEATIDFEIVRGLEYYTGTVFEAYASGLGAQSQICGGGTYQLASLFGGKEAFSTGFGLGFDRIMEIVEGLAEPLPPVVLAFTPDVKAEALRMARELRRSIPIVVDVMGRGLGPQLKAAASLGARHVVIIGRKELDEARPILREMESGDQEELTFEELRERLMDSYREKQAL